MSDEIKQYGNVPRVTPLNHARDSGRRKTPPKQPGKPAAGNPKHKPPGDEQHRVDEYV